MSRSSRARLGRSEARVAREAAGYLREIAATHSTFAIDLAARLARLFYTQGYAQGLRYDPAKLDRIQALAQRQSVVFLPTHKSNLDHLVLRYILYLNGHPPNHTAGGINMSFFPMGPLMRRSGVFFIRRSFKDNDVYKFVLRQYIDYLIEKRFPLEWYIEGGRSRSGKLLPPRFGLLAYVVDSYRRGRADDVALIPVSIAYDQISDVQDYAHEQRGGAKKRESFGWMVAWFRRLRRAYGAIHIDFGEPLSLAKALGPPDPEAAPDPDEQNLALQKLAFEVCVRINAVTPITPVSLVTLALLGTGGVAQTVPGVMLRLKNLLHDVARRDLPNTGLAELETAEGVERVLDALAANEVVDRFAEGSEAVYRIGVERELAAAYYRNSIIHFFVDPAIAELALLEAAEASEHDDRVASFWRAAMQLRDLLKFEFFFADRDAFRGTLRRELADRDPNWEETLARSADGAHELVKRSRPFNAHRVLRPFLEAYRVVADRLEQTPAGHGDRRAGLPRRLHRARAPVSPPAAHPQCGVGLEGAVRDRAQARRQPRPRALDRARDRAVAARVRRADPRLAAPHRRRRSARGEPARGADRVAVKAAGRAHRCYRRAPWWKPSSITSRSACPTSRPWRSCWPGISAGASAGRVPATASCSGSGSSRAAAPIEIIVPDGPPGGFLHRFIAARGAGPHHVTFKVPDIHAALDRARALGYEPVGFDDRSPSWKEAFLHPKQAQGIVVQFAEAHPELEPTTSRTISLRPPFPVTRAAPETVKVVGLLLSSRSEERALRQWQTLLGGALARERDRLVFSWPESPLRIAVRVQPDADEGPLALELCARRVLALPEGPHPALSLPLVQVEEI